MYWEIIADRLHAEGWSYGIAEHFTQHGLRFCVDAYRDGRRFIVKADDLLTAFLSLERDAIAPKGANGMRRATTSPKRIGLKSNRRLSRVLIKRSLITSPDVSTHLWPG
jgi:hypothetical protein